LHHLFFQYRHAQWHENIKYFLNFAKNVAEASMAAFGVVVAGAVIMLAIMCFAICGKGHPDNIPYTVSKQS